MKRIPLLILVALIFSCGDSAVLDDKAEKDSQNEIEVPSEVEVPKSNPEVDFIMQFVGELWDGDVITKIQERNGEMKIDFKKSKLNKYWICKGSKSGIMMKIKEPEYTIMTAWQPVETSAPNEESKVETLIETQKANEDERNRLKCLSDGESLHKELCALHTELQSFKSGNDFREFGFGRGGKYYSWLEKVRALINDERNLCCARNFHCVAGDLETLGREYVQTSGKENEYTKYTSSNFTLSH